MNTVVETYLIEEVESLIYDNEKLDNWNDIVNGLGLEGQKKLSKPEKSPIPFLNMNTKLTNTFQTLCPSRVEIKDFCATPIPVEILELVSLAVRENYFQEIQVWWDEKSIDPVVVGRTGYWYECEWFQNSNHAIKGMEFPSKEAAIEAGARQAMFYETAKYLIGKWADVKHSFEELKEMAKKRYIATESNSIKKTIKDEQRKLDDLEYTAFEMFGI